MARFSSFINEKVSKKEIDKVLTSTDVIIGAEFELKLNDSIFSDLINEYEDKIFASEEFDEEFKKWKDDVVKWKEEKNDIMSNAEIEAYEKFGEKDDYNVEKYDEYVDNETEKWEMDNPYPQEPDEPYNYVSRWNRDIHNFINDLEFEKVEQVVMDQLHNVPKIKNIEKWEIHEDSSLSGLAAEIVSPPMALRDFLDICPNIFKLIDDIGYTDNECGLHIGMSLPGKMDDVDLVKLILFTDENYLWKKFSGREVNTYVEHMQKTIRKEMMRAKGYSRDQGERVSRISQLRKMIRENDIDVSYLKDHYQGINAQHLEERNSYIEFRYMGGKEYHLKWNDVKNIIAHYAYNMKLSCDPNFKKKEYIAKCTRILNKLETWAVMIEIDNAEKKSEENMDSNEKQKYIKNLKKRLQFLPKLTNKEKDFMIDIGA